MPTTTAYDKVPAHLQGLLRHFTDLRDGMHGDAVPRRNKEKLFSVAVDFLDGYARQALAEMNGSMGVDGVKSLLLTYCAILGKG